MGAARKQTTHKDYLNQAKTTQQVKAIWGLAKRHNLDAETLHDVVQQKTGKTSIKLLTAAEADDVIEELGGTRIAPPYPSTRTRQQWNKDAGIQSPITKNQANYLNRLASYRGWNRDALHKFCEGHIKRQFPLTTKEANSVIEALKSMNRREGIRV